MFSIELELISFMSNPKGGNQAPSIRIRCRHIFRVFSTSYEKRFSIKMTLFQRDSRIYYRFEPEGDKSSALYQNPLSTHFSCFLDILCFFLKKIIIFFKNPSFEKKNQSIF